MENAPPIPNASNTLSLFPPNAIVTRDDYNTNQAKLDHLQSVLDGWRSVNETGHQRYMEQEQVKKELQERARAGQEAKLMLEKMEWEDRNNQQFRVPGVASSRLLQGPTPTYTGYQSPSAYPLQSTATIEEVISPPRKHRFAAPPQASSGNIRDQQPIGPQPNSQHYTHSPQNHGSQWTAVHQLTGNVGGQSSRPSQVYPQTNTGGSSQAIVGATSIHRPEANPSANGVVDSNWLRGNQERNRTSSNSSVSSALLGNVQRATRTYQRRSASSDVQTSKVEASGAAAQRDHVLQIAASNAAKQRYIQNVMKQLGPNFVGNIIANVQAQTQPHGKPPIQQPSTSTASTTVLIPPSEQTATPPQPATSLTSSHPSHISQPAATSSNTTPASTSAGPSMPLSSAEKPIQLLPPSKPPISANKGDGKGTSISSTSRPEVGSYGTMPSMSTSTPNTTHLGHGQGVLPNTEQVFPSSRSGKFIHYQPTSYVPFSGGNQGAAPPVPRNNSPATPKPVPLLYGDKKGNFQWYYFTPRPDLPHPPREVLGLELLQSYPPAIPNQSQINRQHGLSTSSSAVGRPFMPTTQSQTSAVRPSRLGAAPLAPPNTIQLGAPRTPAQADKRRLARDIMRSLGSVTDLGKRKWDEYMTEEESTKEGGSKRQSTGETILHAPSTTPVQVFPPDAVQSASDAQHRVQAPADMREGEEEVSDTGGEKQVTAEPADQIPELSVVPLEVSSTTPSGPGSIMSRPPLPVQPSSLLRTPRSSVPDAPQSLLHSESIPHPPRRSQQDGSWVAQQPISMEGLDVRDSNPPEEPVSQRSRTPLGPFALPAVSSSKTPLFLPSPVSSPGGPAAVDVDDADVDVLDDMPPAMADFNASSNVIEIMDNDVETSNRQPKASRGRRRRRVYVLVPPAPEWVVRSKLAAEAKQRNEAAHRTRRERQEQELSERAAVRLSCQVLRESRCRWRNCDVVMNTADKLLAHVVGHAEDDGSEGPYVCLWHDCPRRFSVRSNLTQHLEKHLRSPVFCAYEDCDEAFQTPRELTQHHLLEHRNDKLRPIPAPFQPPLLPSEIGNTPKTLPAHMVEPRDVRQAVISKERHAILGPWVLRNIFGPVNLGPKKHNAAVPLRNNRRGLDKDESPPVQGIKHDEYDFLASSSTRSSRMPRFDDLPAGRVSHLVNEGMMLFGDSLENLDNDQDVDQLHASTEDGISDTKSEGIRESDQAHDLPASQPIPVKTENTELGRSAPGISEPSHRDDGTTVVHHHGWSVLASKDDEDTVDMMLYDG